MGGTEGARQGNTPPHGERCKKRTGEGDLELPREARELGDGGLPSPLGRIEAQKSRESGLESSNFLLDGLGASLDRTQRLLDGDLDQRIFHEVPCRGCGLARCLSSAEGSGHRGGVRLD